MAVEQTQGRTEAAAEGDTEAGTRWQRLQQRAKRTRADIEARRAESASIDSALQAVENNAQTGGGVLAAAVAFRLFMFLVPYSFVMFTGFGLSATAAGQVPEGRGALVWHRRSAGQCGRQHEHHVVGQPPFRARVRRIALAFTARSLVTVLRIVNRLIWGVTPPDTPRRGPR